MADPYGRAIRDHFHDQQDEPLLNRYGNEVSEHSQINDLYFNDFDIEHEDNEWIASWLDGSLLDIGAGTGRHALYFQDHFETVAIEVSQHLVGVMQERGVHDARHVSIFDICDEFERDQFKSALMIGTQLGLTASLQGLRQFLGDLAFVTTPDAIAVLDSYHPVNSMEFEVPGFRPDLTQGAAFRIMQFEYEGDISEPLLFRFFSPERLKEAVVGTRWEISEIRHHLSDPPDVVQYRAALTKRL